MAVRGLRGHGSLVMSLIRRCTHLSASLPSDHFSAKGDRPLNALMSFDHTPTRRYGVIGDRLVWEGGTRAAPHQGVYAAMYCLPRVLVQALDLAVRGMMNRMGEMGEYVGVGVSMAVVEGICESWVNIEIVGESMKMVGVGVRKVGVAEGKVGVNKGKLRVSEVKVGMSEIKVGVSEVKAGVSEIKVVVSEVEVGVSEVKVGVSEVKVGVSEVEVGVNEVKVEVSEVKVGVNEVEVGVSEVKVGVSVRPLSRNASVSWMRDGSILQLSDSADLSGDCVSLAGCDSTFGGHHGLFRHPLGVPLDTYTTRTNGSSGSSSGGSVGDDAGWWAAAWASGRGWNGGQMTPEGLYDTPRGTPCSPARGRGMNRSVSNRLIEATYMCSVNDNKHSGKEQSEIYPVCSASAVASTPCYVVHRDDWIKDKEQKTPTNADFVPPSFAGTYSSTNVTPNPMDNYDVPRPLAETYYDTPRKFFGGPAPVHSSASGTTCSGVLGWAGSLVCGRRDTDQQSTVPFKVNGEGRMPVVDASTGVLLHQPLHIQHQHVQGDLYAVVNKSKNTCPSRSDVKELKFARSADSGPSGNICMLPAVSKSVEHNYVNVPNVSTKNDSKGCESSKVCQNCRTAVSSVQTVEFLKSPQSNDLHGSNERQIVKDSENMVGKAMTSSMTTQSNQSSLSNAHYMIMKPSTESFRQQTSHYICMTSPSFHSLSTVANNKFQTCSLPRQFSGSNFRHSSPQLLDNDVACSGSLGINSSPSSHTLCYSNSNNNLDDEDIHTNERAVRNNSKAQRVPRTGRSLSLARNENLLLEGRQRSNSADSRMGESSIWGCVELLSPPNTPPNTPPISPRRRKRKSGKSMRFGHRRRNDYLLGEDDSGCDVQEAVLRRSSSAPGKTANRDSASSNDSGVSESLKTFYLCQSEALRLIDSVESESLRPLNLMVGPQCFHASLPRFRLNNPLNFSKHHCARDVWCSGTATAGRTYTGTAGGSAGSSSGAGSSGSACCSGSRGTDGRSSASDTSDYHDTLSLASTLSTDQDRQGPGPHATTLRPRTGKDYSRLDRSKLEQTLQETR
ncbi:hypothetical protein FHG87_002656 [Trinorchestia longiramus]|nr:hypothetical protein FHG87_002656 [Trinorchestia longiramus]